MVLEDLRWRQSNFSLDELGGEESGAGHSRVSERGPFARR